MGTAAAMIRYGKVPAGEDISGLAAVSIDLRAETGARVADATCVVAAGVFARSVFARTPGEPPTGEVRFMLAGHEIHLVGERTGREGITEMTLGDLAHMGDDEPYHAQWREYLGLC